MKRYNFSVARYSYRYMVVKGYQLCGLVAKLVMSAVSVEGPWFESQLVEFV